MPNHYHPLTMENGAREFLKQNIDINTIRPHQKHKPMEHYEMGVYAQKQAEFLRRETWMKNWRMMGCRDRRARGWILFVVRRMLRAGLIERVIFATERPLFHSEGLHHGW